MFVTDATSALLSTNSEKLAQPGATGYPAKLNGLSTTDQLSTPTQILHSDSDFSQGSLVYFYRHDIRAPTKMQAATSFNSRIFNGLSCCVAAIFFFVAALQDPITDSRWRCRQHRMHMSFNTIQSNYCNFCLSWVRYTTYQRC